MTAVATLHSGKTIFQDSIVKISIDDVFHIWVQKALGLMKAIIINLSKGLKMILNRPIILGSLWISMLIYRRNIGHGLEFFDKILMSPN